MENSFIHSFIALPIIGFLLSLIIPKQKEQLLSRIAVLTVGIQLITTSIFTTIWIMGGRNIINIKEFSIYSTHGYDFYLDFY
jgi:NADH:ubiquinone oxidoreductase subunit 4 (subunit M)